MLRWITGGNQEPSPDKTDLERSAEKYLLDHGMKAETLERLKKKLRRDSLPPENDMVAGTGMLC